MSAIHFTLGQMGLTILRISFKVNLPVPCRVSSSANVFLELVFPFSDVSFFPLVVALCSTSEFHR